MRSILIDEVEYQLEKIFDNYSIKPEDRFLLEAQIQDFINKENEKFKTELDALTDIYKNIVGPIEHDLINQNTKSASAEADADSIHKLLKSYSNFFGQGLNNELLAVVIGFEPPPAKPLRRKGFTVCINVKSPILEPTFHELLHSFIQ